MHKLSYLIILLKIFSFSFSSLVIRSRSKQRDRERRERARWCINIISLIWYNCQKNECFWDHYSAWVSRIIVFLILHFIDIELQLIYIKMNLIKCCICLNMKITFETTLMCSKIALHIKNNQLSYIPIIK